MIVGRSVERSRLNRLVADAKDGRSRSLVLRGEAGIGKTALLDYASGVAGGMRVLRVVGIESEAEIAFAALQLMFARDIDCLDALPGPQAGALRAAFGMSSTPVDRLLVGAATLTLLSELAGDRPLLCLFDDVQWFDQSSIDALLFAARRLHMDPIAAISSFETATARSPPPESTTSRSRDSIERTPPISSPPFERCPTRLPTEFWRSQAATRSRLSSSRRTLSTPARCRHR